MCPADEPVQVPEKLNSYFKTSTLNSRTCYGFDGMSLVQSIESVIEGSLQRDGYRIVQIQYTGLKSKNLQVMIERLDEKPITIEDCTQVNHTVSTLLDIDQRIQNAYTLEVSSPGLERPLVKLADFERFQGSQVQIKTEVPFLNLKKWVGKIHQVHDQMIEFEVETKDTGSSSLISVPYHQIRFARLVVDFSQERKV